MALTLRANPGKHTWRGPSGGGSFTPRGRALVEGSAKELDIKANPARWESDETYAARVIVGFNVHNEPRWSVDDVIPIVKRVRDRQHGKQGASFVLQRGIYQHKDDEKRIVEEEGVQILIIDVWSTPLRTFEKEMVELGEILADKLQQEEVIVEIQRNGVTVKTFGVVADAA